MPKKTKQKHTLQGVIRDKARGVENHGKGRITSEDAFVVEITLVAINVALAPHNLYLAGSITTEAAERHYSGAREAA